MPQLRYPLTLLTVAIGLGLCADLLFYGRIPGISAPIFVALLLAALAWLSRAENRLPTKGHYWLGVAALFFAVLIAVRASPLLIVLNCMATLGLLLLHVTLYRSESLRRLESWRIALGSVIAALESALLPAPLAFSQVGRLGKLSVHSRLLLIVGRGTLLALPALLVFSGLLAMADSIFASYMIDLFSLQLPFNLAVLGNHIGLTIGFGWAVAGGLIVALHGHGTGELLGPYEMPAEGDTQRLRPINRLRFLGCGEALTVLVLVDILFGAFMLIQGAYLFGGLDTLERTGMTFADYARRGFFELVAVAFLALGLLWTLALVARREQVWERRAFNSASGAMVVLLLGMLISAALRMWLYEQAYGFTWLRLLTHSWMAWLSVVLVLFLVALVRNRPRIFSMGVPVAAAIYLATLNLINPDAIIVRQNIARFHETGDLDTYYLSRLSADAAPDLVAALPEVAFYRQSIVDHLAWERDQLADLNRHDGWPGWNFGRANALWVLRDM